MKYGKFGWNISYEFNEFDFDDSFNVLNTVVANESTICWASFKYFLGEVSERFTRDKSCNRYCFYLPDYLRWQSSRRFR